jgi:uncharacterized protein
MRLQPSRTLGKTGVQVPLIGYGTAPLGKDHVSVEQAEECLNRAIDLGVTYLDTSPDYGSEPKVGEVMKTRRDEVFLATKINCRQRDSVLRELEKSLDKLQTDHVDLIQIHAVNAYADLEQALAEDGTIPALEEAREQGLVKYIGITGHARPELLRLAIDRYPFDAVLVALGMADHLVTNPEEFFLSRAVELNVGVIAMKVLGHGQFKSIDLALRYSLFLPGVSLAIVGMDVPYQVEQIVRIASDARPLSREEKEKRVEEVRPMIQDDAEKSQSGQGPLFWLHDTSVMGWSRDDEPARASYVG